jgi:RNA polymerase sigma factor (sigma-70 family)
MSAISFQQLTKRYGSVLAVDDISFDPRQHPRSGHASRSSRGPTRTDADPLHDDPVVTDLVTCARNGDKHAWDALVERYAPLIWSICRRHRLGDADAEDVGQSVWLRLVEQLGRVRDPAALPGWLATVTRRECLRVLRAARGPLTAGYGLDAEFLPDEQARTAEQELLLAERHAALREAFLDLPPGGQQLIALLIQDPPVPYAEISARLGIPVGSIGPTRSRCLDQLRRSPAIAALINADSSVAADCHTAAAVNRRGAAAGSVPTAAGAAEPTARWSSVNAEQADPLPQNVGRTSLPNPRRTQKEESP